MSYFIFVFNARDTQYISRQLQNMTNMKQKMDLKTQGNVEIGVACLHVNSFYRLQ